MYESEVNGRVESADQIPAPILQRFRELGERLTARTALPWGEHCTECVWPTCYSTCDLYSPRLDGKCRRFVDGMVRLDAPGTVNGYVIKIAFKQWGKLWTEGNVNLVSPDRARSLEQWDRRLGQALYQIALPASIKRVAISRRYGYKKKQAQSRVLPFTMPDHFVVECYNPALSPIGLSLTMRSPDDAHPIPFQRLLTLEPGYNRSVIAAADIARVLDLRAAFDVELIPNNVPDGTVLYFGLLDFVSGAGIQAAESRNGKPATVAASNGSGAKAAGGKVKTIKCVVWDLDNTTWQGILVEDGPQGLQLKPGLPDLLKKLDQRGILHSVASKNNFDEAWKQLEQFGISEYFLSPEISWGPKSEALKRIAERLNIGLDTLLFVDDSPFELAEVRAACPDVRVLDAAEYLTLPDRPECQVPVTAEAADRRKMYQMEAVRQSAADKFGSDYFAFLRDCRLEAHLRPLTAANLQRVHELTQRTNQMNFSGNRYERSVLEQVLASPDLETYVLDCRDRFGEYGVVGFCIVDRREPRITDLMFSCRVQSKRVEHALLTYILRHYTNDKSADVHANYRKTPRNAPSGRVFDDMGFQTVGEQDGVLSLVFRKDQDVPDDGIVDVILHTENEIEASRA
jgi:FkbH-like protein